MHRNFFFILTAALLAGALTLAGCGEGRSASADEIRAAQAAHLEPVRFRAPGMFCAGCVGRIQAELQELGVTAISANLETKVVTGYYDPARVNPEQIRATVERLGYGVEDFRTGAEAR